jgi:hypothetical protein
VVLLHCAVVLLIDSVALDVSLMLALIRNIKMVFLRIMKWVSWLACVHSGYFSCLWFFVVELAYELLDLM